MRIFFSSDKILRIFFTFYFPYKNARGFITNHKPTGIQLKSFNQMVFPRPKHLQILPVPAPALAPLPSSLSGIRITYIRLPLCNNLELTFLERFPLESASIRPLSSRNSRKSFVSRFSSFASFLRTDGRLPPYSHL